jgi:hypothetical protein
MTPQNQTFKIPNHTEWIEKISATSEDFHSNCEHKLEISARDYPQDESLSILKDLLERGYTEAEWHAENSQCEKCRSLHGKKWDLNSFLNETEYEAPVFSRSHVGDRSCYLIVRGPDLEEIRVGPYPFR